jgi:hypothetical protein
MGTARIAASLALLRVGLSGTLATIMGGTKAMKCKCPSETHGHEAGKCNNLATEPDRMCKPCHDKVAKEMHVAHPTDNQTPINQPRR